MLRVDSGNAMGTTSVETLGQKRDMPTKNESVVIVDRFEEYTGFFPLRYSCKEHPATIE